MQEESHFLIVGLGLLGGSYAQGLKRKGFHVSALDLNPESIAYALKQGWIDEGAVGFDEALVRQADSVVFGLYPVSYTHLRAHETGRNLVCRLLLEKKKTKCKKKKKNE